MEALRSPFPWFGGKSKAAPLIWKRLGNVKNYVEPFFGSGACLLLRPNYDPFLHTETINDKDCFVSNFWRALQSDSEAVARYCDYPVNEADLSARHLWLVNQVNFQERMKTDPDFYDTKIAGWWVWGLCQWIGSGWCSSAIDDEVLEPCVGYADTLGNNGRGVHRKRPHLGNNGMGVHRQLPHLGNNGMGVHRQLPHLGDNGMGVHRQSPHMNRSDSKALVFDREYNASPASTFGGQRYGSASQASDLYEYFEALANRLRRVRVCCGDWKRVLGPSPTEKIGVTGIILDPPYDRAIRSKNLYSVESDISADVRAWAIENGNNPKLRIALCGYEDEHDMPLDWECVEWKAAGGYGSQRQDKSNENGTKERVWFSPHCLKPKKAKVYSQFSLFEVGA